MVIGMVASLFYKSSTYSTRNATRAEGSMNSLFAMYSTGNSTMGICCTRFGSRKDLDEGLGRRRSRTREPGRHLDNGAPLIPRCDRSLSEATPVHAYTVLSKHGSQLIPDLATATLNH